MTQQSGTIPTVNQELIDAIKEEEEFSNGDIYDEDLGRYLATMELKVEGDAKESIPAKLSIYMDGYWYVYTPIARYKQEKEDAQSQTEKA